MIITQLNICDVNLLFHYRSEKCTESSFDQLYFFGLHWNIFKFIKVYVRVTLRTVIFDFSP